MWSLKRRTVHISGVTNQGLFCRGKGRFGVQIQPRQETTSETSGCCVLGDVVAGLQFIFPFVWDYTVTFLESASSLVGFSFSTQLYFTHSVYLRFSTVQIYTTHHTGCIENTHTRMSKNQVLSLSLSHSLSPPLSLSRSYYMVTILSWSSLQLASAPWLAFKAVKGPTPALQVELPVSTSLFECVKAHANGFKVLLCPPLRKINNFSFLVQFNWFLPVHSWLSTRTHRLKQVLVTSAFTKDVLLCKAQLSVAIQCVSIVPQLTGWEQSRKVKYSNPFNRFVKL